MLCGVGRDSHGKGQVVLWSSAHTPHTGDVSVLAKAHTDVSIERMRIAGFDDSRLGCVCGRVDVCEVKCMMFVSVHCSW